MSSRVSVLALAVTLCLAATGSYAQQQSAKAPAARMSSRPASNASNPPRSSAAPAQPQRSYGVTTPERRNGPSGYSGRGHGYSYGSAYPGSYSDYGNLTNRPGAGHVPPSPRTRYPGTSYPWSGVQPLPTTTQPLPGTQLWPGAQVRGPIGNTIPTDRDWRHQRRGGAIYYVPYPVYVPSYDPNYYPGAPAAGEYTGYDPNVYGNVPQYDPNAPLPQDPNDRQPQVWNGPSTFVDDQSVNENVTVIHPSAENGRPLTLLVFKDHSIYAVTDYWKRGDRVYYVTNYGSENSVGLDQIDVDFSVRLNGERNVPFELRDRP